MPNRVLKMNSEINAIRRNLAVGSRLGIGILIIQSDKFYSQNMGIWQTKVEDVLGHDGNYNSG